MYISVWLNRNDFDSIVRSFDKLITEHWVFWLSFGAIVETNELPSF